MTRFIYLTQPGGLGVYVAAERIISVAPCHRADPRAATKYVVKFDAGGGEVASGTTCDGSLVEGRQRLPAPSGLTVEGRPVLWLELEDGDEGNALAAVFDAARGEIRLTEIPIREDIAQLGDQDEEAEAAVEAAERAAGASKAKAG